jgi:carotenoid 1,2-hydratase
MTERGAGDVARGHDVFHVGPSLVRWEDGTFTFAIDEWTAPLPRPLRGVVSVRPAWISDTAFSIDSAGRHHWRPVAPRARVDVKFDRPNLAWSGDGYLDSNWGEEPLERAFKSWHWSRAHAGDSTQVFYDIEAADGGEKTLALSFAPSGVTEIPAPPKQALPPTFWGMRRLIRAEAPKSGARTLEDSPFYARSALNTHINGFPAQMVQESLSLRRFRAPIVRLMLPFRMPRIARRC